VDDAVEAVDGERVALEDGAKDAGDLKGHGLRGVSLEGSMITVSDSGGRWNRLLWEPTGRHSAGWKPRILRISLNRNVGCGDLGVG
jgi:hypothetical protein